MIRRARAADAEAVDRLHIRAWRHAYGDFIEPDRIGADPVEERLARWRKRLVSDAIVSWVWDQDDQVAGFASAGEADEEGLGGVACLFALYVDPPAQGAGVGAALLAHAEAALSERGFEDAVLWVFTENERGRRFYEARGWELELGSEDTGDWAAPGVRYRRRL